MHLIHFVWESWEKHTSMWLGLLHAFCNLSIQLVSQLTFFPLPPSPPTICCLELLVEPFKGIAKVFPSHRGASSQCYWPPSGDCRLRPTQLSFIAIPSLGLLYVLRHFNAIFMRIFAHCNEPLSQYNREDYFNCDSCNASSCCLCDERELCYSNSHFTFSTHYLVN